MVRTCALWKETNQKVSWARFDQCLGSSVGRAQALDLLESACEMQRSPVRIRPKTLLHVSKKKKNLIAITASLDVTARNTTLAH